MMFSLCLVFLPVFSLMCLIVFTCCPRVSASPAQLCLVLGLPFFVFSLVFPCAPCRFIVFPVTLHVCHGQFCLDATSCYLLFGFMVLLSIFHCQRLFFVNKARFLLHFETRFPFNLHLGPTFSRIVTTVLFH